MDVAMQQGGLSPTTAPNVTPHVLLLGAFAVRSAGRPVRLPKDAQRLVAFLALRRKRMPRAFVAGTLWIDGSQAQAFGSLRSALWRLRSETEALVEADSDTLALAPRVHTDVAEARSAAARLCDPSDPCDESPFTISTFVDELLPGWYDEWVLFERERVRQLSLHALESIAIRLADEQRYATAIEAALSAISLDPLRESAHRCLIRIHLKEGNRSEAARHFTIFQKDLADQLGLAPSEQMMGLIANEVATPR